MRLNEIKPVMDGAYNLTEGVIPVHITMTLEQVIAAGKVTNSVQHFIMAGLVGIFKDGQDARWPRDLNSYPMQTGSDALESIKALSPQNSVMLAEWLRQQLTSLATFESNPYAWTNPQLNIEDWMRWVTKKQD